MFKSLYFRIVSILLTKQLTNMSDPEQVVIELQGNVHHAVPLEDDGGEPHKQGKVAPLSGTNKTQQLDLLS